MKCKVNTVKQNGKQLCSVLNLDYICKLMLKQFKIMVNCIPNILLMFSLPSYTSFSPFWTLEDRIPNMHCNCISSSLLRGTFKIRFSFIYSLWRQLRGGCALQVYKLCWFGALRFPLEISKHRIASSKSECFGNFGNIALPFL